MLGQVQTTGRLGNGPGLLVGAAALCLLLVPTLRITADSPSNAGGGEPGIVASRAADVAVGEATARGEVGLEQGGADSAPRTSDNDIPVPTDAEADRIRIEFDSGVVKAGQQAQLSFSRGGTIQEIKVRAGDRVKDGDLLAVLSTSSEIDVLEIDLRDARLELEEVVRSAGTDKLQVARAELAISRLRLLQEQAVKSSRLVAPFDGVVVDVRKGSAEYAQAGEPLVEVVNPKMLRGYGDVSLGFVRYLQQGTPVRIESVAHTDKGPLAVVTGKVRLVDPAVDHVRTDRVRVVFDVPNPDEKFRAGMRVKITAEIDSPEGQQVNDE